MRNFPAISIVLATIICSVSAYNLSSFRTSEISRLLMEGRKLGGRLGCVHTGVGMLHKLGFGDQLDDHPKETPRIKELVVSLFTALNQPGGMDTARFREPLRSKLLSYAQQCLISLGTIEVVQDGQLLAQQVASHNQNNDFDELDITDNSEAPTEQNISTISDFDLEPESEIIPELKPAPEAILSTQEPVQELEPEANVLSEDEQARISRRQTSLKDKFQQKQRELEEMKTIHGLNVRDSMRKLRDEKNAIDARLKNMGMIMRPDHSVNKLVRHASNIQYIPNVDDLKNDMDKASERMRVNEGLINPHRVSRSKSM